MSWLLVAGVPVLLMLAALGLGRLEKELVRDPAAVADVDEFLERTGGVDMHTLAAEGMPEALEYLHRREAQQSAGPAPAGAAAVRGTPRRPSPPASSTPTR
ncbi:hypothetical protein I549_0453 [Mycobacterium avium subsp. avium 2285 (R)]|nr:hypothetical protein I549_0453 [Mycobacterium avium subsp. avium 2285 (R)]